MYLIEKEEDSGSGTQGDFFGGFSVPLLTNY